MADFDLEEPEEVPPLKPDDTGSRMPGMESRHSPQPFAPFGTSPAAYSSDDMRKLPPQEGIAPAQEEYPRQEDGQYQEDSAFGGPHEHSPNDMGFPPAAQDDWEEAAPQEEEYQEQWDQSVPPQGAPMGTPQRDVLPYEQDLTPNALPTGLSGGGAPSSFYRQPSGDEWAKNFHEDTAIPQPPPASKTENYIAMPTPIRPELPSPPTPVKATQEEGREIDAVNMPQQASDPTFQQYSIANLKNRDESFAQGGTVEPAPEAPAPSSFDDMVAASALPQSPTANYHSAGEYESMYPHGVSQVPTSEKAVNADGVPRHIPDLPPPEVDYSAPSRRLAGAAWVLFSILLSLFFVYHNRMTLGSVFAAPAFLMGAIMLVAGRWSAVLAMLLGLAYGVFFGWVGYDLMYGQTYTTQYGFQDLPNTVAICFMLLGLLFVMGNLVMLPGTPGLGRAALGGFVVVLPAVALLIVQIMPTISSPSLGPPKGIEAAQEFGSTLEGLNFSKPAGWGQYPWEVAEKNFRFLDHLFQEPNYYFFNEKRTALVAFYLDERPTGASVLKSFLGQDSRTELENQVTAGLPQVNKERLYFEHEGRQFERRMYEGQLSNGRRIAVTVDKTPVAGKMLLMVVTRNAASEFNHDQAIAALDKFRESLQLQPE